MSELPDPSVLDDAEANIRDFCAGYSCPECGGGVEVVRTEFFMHVTKDCFPSCPHYGGAGATYKKET